jgi:hypothetical protein
MSSVIIAGNTSGTITLDAPNVAGTTTLTLPATTGTFITTTGGVTPGTAGNVLQSNGTTWTSAAVSAGGLGGTTVFTANGTFTIPTGKTVVKVTVIGGGGAGGTQGSCYNGAAGGGGGGGAAVKYLTGLTPGNTLTVTRGAAGGTSSVASGTQSITTISATGGSTGSVGTMAVLGGNGGSGTNGDWNIQGQKGFYGHAWDLDCQRAQYGGTGGASILGFGGVGSIYGVGAPNNASFAGQNYGSGGGGGQRDNGAGGAGAVGVVIFEY